MRNGAVLAGGMTRSLLAVASAPANQCGPPTCKLWPLILEKLHRQVGNSFLNLSLG